MSVRANGPAASWKEDGERWVGLARPEVRDRVQETLGQLGVHTRVAFCDGAQDLRELASRYGWSAVVGPVGDGVSGVNIAAALASDGSAARVVLVAEDPSGSLRSRASRAGINAVLALAQEDVAIRAAVHGERAGEPRLGGFPARVAALPEVGLGPWVEDPLSDPELDEPELEAEVVPTSVLTASDSSCGGSGDPAGREGPRRLPVDAGPEGDELPFAVEEAPRAPRPLAIPSARGKRGGAPTLVFASGRGGVGKTTIVSTAAEIAASWGMRVAVCDLDLSCGNLYSQFGLPGPADLSVLEGQTEIAEVAERIGIAVGESIRVWGPCGLPEMSEVAAPKVTELLQALGERSDIVLVDTSSTFTDAVAQAAQCCDRLLLVADGGAGSAVAMARLGALAVRLGVARTRIVRVANRSDGRLRQGSDPSHAEVGLETSKEYRVLEGGGEVEDMCGAGKVAALVDAGSDYVDSVAAMLAQVLNEMGSLPQDERARKALEAPSQRKRWVFGKRREAM